MADRSVGSRLVLRSSGSSTLVRFAALALVLAASACGRYDRELATGDDSFDSNLGETGDDTTSGGTSTTSGGTTTTTTNTSGPVCDDPCSEIGARACDGDGVITCEDAAGCAAWSAPIACAADEHCDVGACVLIASTRFDEPIAWAVPEGGNASVGFNGLTGVAAEIGDAWWSVVDVDGDRRLDVVVTSRAVDNQNTKIFQRTLGYPNAPYWEVYRGLGAGFAAQPMPWMVPGDGHDGHGLVTIDGTPELLGDAWWTLLDVDGDARPELVITGHSTVFDGWIGRPPGYPKAPHWEVYASDDHGFVATPKAWALPEGGPVGYGFYTHEDKPWYVGDPAWTTRDLDGDGFVDLVITGVAVDLINGNPVIAALGSADDPRWEVYRGGADGFAATPTLWPAPQGGWTGRGFGLAEGEPVGLGDDRWRLADLDGDGRDDLVVVASAVAVAADDTLELSNTGYPEAPHWWFHRNLGDGFERAPAAWALPVGGRLGAGFIDFDGAALGVGDQSWSLRDLDGDGRRELVILSAWEDVKAPDCEGQALGIVDGDPHWDVHEPVQLGFDAAPRAFAIPAVGPGVCGLTSVAGAPLAEGDPAWETIDVDGDRRPDLVLTAEGVGDPVMPVVYGHGVAPQWTVHRGVP